MQLALYWDLRLSVKQQIERKLMNDQFDELAKGMAQSVTRRGALKKFGAGLAGIALASLGLANDAHAGGAPGTYCQSNRDCASRICKRYKVPCTSKDTCGHIGICQ